MEFYCFFHRTDDFLGWGFSIFDKEKLTGQYSILVDEEDLKITNSLDDKILSKIIDPSKIDSFTQLLNPATIEIAYEKGDYEFADMIGLVNIEYVSFAQIDSNVEDYEVEKV